MKLKNFGIYDDVLKEYVRTFTAKDNNEAQRAAKYIVREKGFDDIAGKNYSVVYLYTLDTETGNIIDNSISPVCGLASFIDERNNEQLELIAKHKLFDEKFINEIKEMVKGEILNDVRNSKGRKEAGN